MKINGLDLIMNCLLGQGVDTVFGFPGSAVLNIYDALYKCSDKIRHILTCHEQGGPLTPPTATHVSLEKSAL